MKRLLILVAVLLVAAPVYGQGLAINPTTITFDASTEHNSLKLDGTPVVTGYQALFYLESDTNTIKFTYELNKPTPDGQGMINILNPTFFTPLIDNTKYVCKIRVYGPDGDGWSPISNPFGNDKPKVPTLTKPPVVKK